MRGRDGDFGGLSSQALSARPPAWTVHRDREPWGVLSGWEEHSSSDLQISPCNDPLLAGGTMRQGPSSRGQRWESAPPPPEAGAASGSPRMEGPCWEEVTGQGRLTPRVLSGARGGGVSEWAVGRVSGSWGRLLVKTWGDVRWFWGLCVPLQPCPARPPRAQLRLPPPPNGFQMQAPRHRKAAAFPGSQLAAGTGRTQPRKSGPGPPSPLTHAPS